MTTCDDVQLALIGGTLDDAAAAHAVGCDACRFVAAMSRRFRSLADPRSADLVAALPDGEPLLGRYLLERRIGRGGQGVVFQARDLDGDEVVAVKVVHGDSGAAEVVNAHRVHHPAVCRVYHSERRGPLRVIVMELIEGSSLAERVPLPTRVALPLFLEIAAAVHAGHEAGVLHLDLKPENVLLRADGRPVITDFGLSVRTDGSGSARSPGGTTAFMAPEALRGEAVDRRADVFALGVLLERMIRSRPRWMRRAIDRATARDPSDRPPTALALARAVDVPARRRRLARRAVAATAAIGIAGAAAFFVAPPPTGPRAPWRADLWGTDRVARRDWNVAVNRGGGLPAALPDGPPFACARNARELTDGLTTYSDWEHGWAFAGRRGACVAPVMFPHCGERDPAAATCTLADGTIGQLDPAADCAQERSVVVDLGARYRVTAVRAWYRGYSQVPAAFRIQVDDGTGDFREVFATRENTKGMDPAWEPGGPIGTSVPVTTEVVPVSARRVRLVVDPCSTRRGAEPGDVVWLYEIEVFASIGRAAAWRRRVFG